LLWSQAHQRQERADWGRTLSLVNTVSQALGGETVTLKDLYEKAPDSRDTDAYEAFKGRTQGWAADLVTDFDAPEM